MPMFRKFKQYKNMKNEKQNFPLLSYSPKVITSNPVLGFPS